MLKKIFKIVISIAILVVLYFKLDVDFKTIFKHIEYPQYFFLSLLFPIILIPVIANSRWRFFLKCIGIKEELLTLIKITFLSTYYGLLLPSSQGYDLIRIYKIEKKHPNHKGELGGVIIIERIYGLVTLSLMGFIASAFIPITKVTYSIWIFCAILFVFVFFIRNTFTSNLLIKSLKLINKLDSITSYLEKVINTLRVFPIKKSWFTTFIFILLLQLSNILIVSFLFKMMSYDIPFIFHLYAFPIISIVSMIPISFSGIGVREGAFVFIYSMFNTPDERFLFISLLYYLLTMITPALIGFIINLSELRH